MSLEEIIADHTSHINKSAIYLNLIGIARVLLMNAKISSPNSVTSGVGKRLYSVSILSGYMELSDIFCDIGEFDFYFGADKSDFISRVDKLITTLDKLKSEDKINPNKGLRSSQLLDTHSLPILEKMVAEPERSPRYFREMVRVLDDLIKNSGLSPQAAASEVMCAIERPQIVADASLFETILAAYDLELPLTIRRHDPMRMWQNFVDTM